MSLQSATCFLGKRYFKCIQWQEKNEIYLSILCFTISRTQYDIWCTISLWPVLFNLDARYVQRDSKTTWIITRFCVISSSQTDYICFPWCSCLRHPVFYREAHPRPACQVPKQACLWTNCQVSGKPLFWTRSLLHTMCDSKSHSLCFNLATTGLLPCSLKNSLRFCVPCWGPLWWRWLNLELNVGLCVTNSGWPSCRSSGY